ncbi:membrane metallo-endopeptidase-like 1 [Drosophila takahashii]|uniref:membrane metallo-endopeptidase-like 1 n=1 Tax=Drosophila takahashii TaxID=29030 RepID=UPI001CF8FA84|nr:membrane metallo-endopeptidase-like 1 [Drosophila takahashii]
MKWFIYLFLGSVVWASRSSDLNRRLLNNILGDGRGDTSPCTDYYNYACGKYGQRHINDSFVGIFQVLSHKVNKKLLQLMEENGEKSLNESSVEAKALRFYLNCREAPPETRKIEHYLRQAPPAEGLTWPPLNPPGTPWPDDQFTWIETLAHLSRYGLSDALIQIEVTQNYQKNTEFLLKLGSPELATILDLVEVQRALRAMSVPLERIKTLIRTLRRLDWDVRTVIVNHDNGRSRVMSVQKLNSETGYDWQKFIEIIVGHRVQPNFRVEVENIEYLKEIRQLIDGENVELVANYMMGKFIEYLQSSSDGGGDPLECIKDVRRNMGLASNLLYKDRFIKDLPAQTKKVEWIFGKIRQQLIDKIERNRLDLTPEQRGMVTRKVSDLVLNIGHMPKFLEHRDFANEYYMNLEIPSEDLDFAREHLKVLKFRMQKELAYLRHPQNLLLESVDATTSDPVLMGRQNYIVVPYDLLQDPFFSFGSDDKFQFSLLGFSLARELMRSVDDINVQYDTHGNLNEIGIEISNSPRFEEAVQCVKETNEEDMNERLADIGGLNLAYSAYLASRKGTVSGATKETFFRNLAQFFCTDGLPDANGQHKNQLNLEYMLQGFAPFDRALECRRVALQCQFW